MDANITLIVDGTPHALAVDTRITVLDTLRDRLGNSSPKQGCDHGQCGACTVLLNGRRTLSCLTFAVANNGADITTAAGLGTAEHLHPVQQALLERDGFQCGYCTPGQVCSAVGMLDEVGAGMPSSVTAATDGSEGSDGDPEPRIQLDDNEIRERMSGNLCRCGAYTNIVAAIRQVAST